MTFYITDIYKCDLTVTLMRLKLQTSAWYDLTEYFFDLVFAHTITEAKAKVKQHMSGWGGQCSCD